MAVAIALAFALAIPILEAYTDVIYDGNAKFISIPRIRRTTSTSISVKPFLRMTFALIGLVISQ